MGKKKAFINKKKAVTYSLVYRDPSEDPDGEDGGQRVLAPVGGPRGLHHTSDDYSDTYEYEDSVYDSEYTFSMSRSAAAHHDESYTLSEERRRELLALGFPDDGYDYLRHLRDLGRGNQQQFPHRGGAAAAAAGGGRLPAVETIPEDQELTGFSSGDDGEEEEAGEEEEEDFSIYDYEQDAAGAAGGQRKKLDATVLAAAAAAAAADAGAGPSTSGAGGATAAAVLGSVAGRSTAAPPRSVASTARTHGSGFGPSVYVRAARLVAPKADVKVVDARGLVVRPKGHDEAAAAAALAEVSALSRHTELYGTRGKLYQARDLEEVEKSIAALETGNDPSRAEEVEGGEWADWLDEFVANGGDGAGTSTTGREYGGAAGDGDEDDEEGGTESEEPEEDEGDEDEWRLRHRRQQQEQQQDGPAERRRSGDVGDAEGDSGGPGGGAAGVAASVASSLWRRPERRDRKEALEALDVQFERLAVEYDDGEIGALHNDGLYDEDEDEDDFGSDGDGGGGGAAGDLRQRGGRNPAGAAAAAAGVCELSDFAHVLDEFLTEHRASEALEAEGLKPLQASERWDCESILSLTSNLENYPAKIVDEPQHQHRRNKGGVAAPPPAAGGLIRLSAKTGMPVLVSGTAAVAAAPAGGGGAAAVTTIPEEAAGGEGGEEDEQQDTSGSGDEQGAGGSVLDPALLARRKGETAEERKARKSAVKEARRNQRSAKKEMKTMFRQQATRAQKQAAGKSQAAGSTYVIP
ncbi:hypothetical protein VOLCADRAFT_92444 [Volvox carteri f. nagariensis]|uniref:Protein LTV1 homolog n=1 Tax=Volvox carteri f. nagariensis TaxID=3068 RepID=D8TZP0_VOLCA|nr:uncharacterized protein VOLCADRAFT_92444 [Volvox carteri f. nagariensis]EFJ46956.1 hypothetical protein VOLCADRAFT_92444 [Volvox carteri f. nagariensis]|eukprot:XP_002951851.1 hypothetical protein VOLCADRAFT_92444 [Volvox carteri f. nagariensis]